jgi:hypothetical protein
MAEKCESCGEKIEYNELGKINGTIKKVKKDKKNELVYFCSSCQKEGKDKASSSEQ